MINNLQKERKQVILFNKLYKIKRLIIINLQVESSLKDWLQLQLILSIPILEQQMIIEIDLLDDITRIIKIFFLTQLLIILYKTIKMYLLIKNLKLLIIELKDNIVRIYQIQFQEISIQKIIEEIQYNLQQLKEIIILQEEIDW